MNLFKTLYTFFLVRDKHFLIHKAFLESFHTFYMKWLCIHSKTLYVLKKEMKKVWKHKIGIQKRKIERKREKKPIKRNEKGNIKYWEKTETDQGSRDPMKTVRAPQHKSHINHPNLLTGLRPCLVHGWDIAYAAKLWTKFMEETYIA